MITTDRLGDADLKTAGDEGYVRGLHAAARWLAAFDQDLPGFDRPTCQHLARGMQAMVGSAAERLGVNPPGTNGQGLADGR